MITRCDLKTLTPEQKDALIEELWGRLEQYEAAAQQAQKQLEHLEERVSKPKKTSKNSSEPPSKGFKPKVKSEKKKSGGTRLASVGRRGGGRRLSESPQNRVLSYVSQCKTCGISISQEIQRLRQRYEKIELPEITPIVTRIERYGCDCPGCGEAQLAPAPKSLEPGSPFGERVMAYVLALRYGHALSYERLSQTMAELFNLKLSEGALANLFKRAQERLQPAVGEIVTRIRQAQVVGSDETGARVQGKTAWEWVFQNQEVCLHVIRSSRGSDVIREVMDGHQPETWISDLFSAQKTHPAEDWQVCLAHQLRDCQYGIDAGDTVFSKPMKRLFVWAIAVRNRWARLSESTRYQYRCRVQRWLEQNLALSPTQEDGQRLHRRYSQLREHLFLFLDDILIPATNNASEQALRWSVIFRKVTNGFRSEWGKELFAAVRSIVNTGKRQGLSTFQAICAALDPKRSLFPLS